MKKRTTLLLLLSMIFLILDSRCAADSAREALILCCRTLIPSLFPLFVLGGMLVPALAQIRIPGLSRILGFPEGYFLLGLLGGYPLGAACIASALSLFGHRSNIQRLIHGEENRLDFQKISKVSEKVMQRMQKKNK